jgi:uroporphyrinogen-III synthase
MGANALPLSGQRVLILRPKDQGFELMDLLRAQGAEVVHLPLIEIQPPSSFDALDDALRNLSRYQWVLFTSANGVRSFVARAITLNLPLTAITDGDTQVCVIGPATRDIAVAEGLPVHRLPKQYIAEGIADAFAEDAMQGVRVLLPRAEVARDVAPNALRTLGAEVDIVDAYRSGIPSASKAELLALRERGWQPDWIVFTSSSTVTHFLAVGGESYLPHTRVLSIGPATSSTMRANRIVPDVECKAHTNEGIVEALLGHVSL